MPQKSPTLNSSHPLDALNQGMAASCDRIGLLDFIVGLLVTVGKNNRLAALLGSPYYRCLFLPLCLLAATFVTAHTEPIYRLGRPSRDSKINFNKHCRPVA